MNAIALPSGSGTYSDGGLGSSYEAISHSFFQTNPFMVSHWRRSLKPIRFFLYALCFNPPCLTLSRIPSHTHSHLTLHPTPNVIFLKKKKYNHISIKSKGRLWGLSSLAFLGSSARFPTLCSEGLMHLTSSSPRERLQQVLTLCVLYLSVWGCFLLSFPVWLDWLSPHSVLSSHGLGSYIPSLVLCSFTSSLIKAVHLMLVRLMGQNRLCNSYKGYLPRVSGPRADFLPLTHLQWL